MNAKLAETIAKTLSLIALVIALYSAYLIWSEDNVNLYLSTLIVVLTSLSLLISWYSKKTKKTK